jgi:hypothetical protein
MSEAILQSGGLIARGETIDPLLCRDAAYEAIDAVQDPLLLGRITGSEITSYPDETRAVTLLIEDLSNADLAAKYLAVPRLITRMASQNPRANAITFNFMPPGTRLQTHRDQHAGKVLVVNALGTGVFEEFATKTGLCVRRFDLEEGQSLSIANPANIEDRPPHAAYNPGETLRISAVISHAARIAIFDQDSRKDFLFQADRFTLPAKRPDSWDSKRGRLYEKRNPSRQSYKW